MPINKNVFIHDSDKAALQALKSIPGFSQLLKAFMKVWNENLMYIENMSTNVRISDAQLSIYKEMLIPICNKLGIDVPDLFLKLDVEPNAWTYGDTKPYIVITSGLIETIPEALMPTVLAHECGHIACHHVLYRTMGTLILNGALNLIPLNVANIAIYPIKAAFAYWMRCSELSADRAAALCDGTVSGVTEMCMRFAGFDKDIPHEMNLDAFMEQAIEYKRLVDNNAWNKTMEFMLFANNDHPINAVRAYEIKEWEKSEDFIKAKQYFESYSKDAKPREMPIPWNEKHFVGRNYEEVEKELIEFGFYDVELIREYEKPLFSKAGNVLSVNIDKSNKYKEGDWIAADSLVEIKYYLPLTEEEIIAQHTGEIRFPYAPAFAKGKDYLEIKKELIDLGFENIIVEEIRDVTNNKRIIGKIANITIDNSPLFSKGDWVSITSSIKIIYHSEK